MEERTQVAAALAFFAEGHQLSAVSGAQKVHLPEVEQLLPSLKFCPPGGMREHGEVFSCKQSIPLRSALCKSNCDCPTSKQELHLFRTV